VTEGVCSPRPTPPRHILGPWGARRLMSAFLSLICLVSSGTASAWGTAGHAIIADIAESRLSPTTLGQVQQLLALIHQRHLASIASWADEWRFNHPETGRWHYVDIPLSVTDYNPARDCPSGSCVVAKIEEFTKALTDRSRSPQERLQALEFVVHFVADVHQPLHASNNGDEGGNLIPVTYLGQAISDRGYPWTLHSVWDTAIIEHHLALTGVEQDVVDGERADVRAMARNLGSQIDLTLVNQWTKVGLDPASWAMESHDVARSTAYLGVLDGNDKPLPEPIVLGADYDNAVWAAIEVQLEKAGVRLAATLNAALK